MFLGSTDKDDFPLTQGVYCFLCCHGAKCIRSRIKLKVCKFTIVKHMVLEENPPQGTQIGPETLFLPRRDKSKCYDWAKND